MRTHARNVEIKVATAVFSLLGLLLVAGAGWAQESASQETEQLVPVADPVGDDVDSLEILLAQQHSLRERVAAGDLDGLTARETRKLGEAQDEVFEVTEGKSRLDQLNINEKVKLENSLERINALVKNTRAGDDEQQVCWRERKSGSTVKVTRCGSQAEVQQAREGARAWMEGQNICSENCGG